MNRTRRAIGAACLAVVALLGCSAHTSEPASKPKPACKWLAHNH